MALERKNQLIAILFASILAAVVGYGFSTPTLIANSALAQSTSMNSSASAIVDYGTSYGIESTGVAKPVTLQLESHLYHPGDAVKVHGSVWMDIVQRVDALNAVKVEIKDNAGNVVARENATLNKTDGSYSSSLNLLDNAGKGTYTVDARLELEADALGIIQAITSATLQSSIQFAVATPSEYPVNAEGKDFKVFLASNSGINDFQFKQSDKRVSFFVEGDAGTKGVTEITIPTALLSGEMKVFMDQNLVANEDVIVKSKTDVATTFEINYNHSIHRMEVTGTNVVPEFPLSSVVLIAGVIGVIVALTRTRIDLFRGRTQNR